MNITARTIHKEYLWTIYSRPGYDTIKHIPSERTVNVPADFDFSELACAALFKDNDND